MAKKKQAESTIDERIDLVFRVTVCSRGMVGGEVHSEYHGEAKDIDGAAKKALAAAKRDGLECPRVTKVKELGIKAF